MTDPRIVAGFDAHASDPELHLQWDRGTGKGAGLPSAYFSGVRVSDLDRVDRSEVNPKLAVSAQQVAPREIVIRLAPGILAEHLDDDYEVAIALSFPDRRGFIDCVHPASADAYLVVITLTLQQGVLTRATVEQVVYLGDF